MTDAEIDELELAIIGSALEDIERMPTHEAKIAAMRCFVRGIQGKQPLRGDLDLLECTGGQR